MNSVCMRRPAEFFRIIEAAPERAALRGRQLLEDLGLLVLRQVFEDRHRVVGFELAHAFGDRARRQLVEDFLAHRVVDFGQRGEVEIDAEQFDQAGAQLRRQRLDQCAHVGFVQAADLRAQRADVARLDAARHAFDEGLADGAVFVARQRHRRVDALVVFLLEHAGLRRVKTGRLYAASPTRANH